MKWRWMIASPLVFVALALSLSAQPTALDEGVRLFREGRFDQALVKLEEAHRIAPRNATVENLLGITETRLGHSNEACNHYRNGHRQLAREAQAASRHGARTRADARRRDDSRRGMHECVRHVCHWHVGPPDR